MRTINEMIAHLNPCKEAVEWLGNEIDIKKAWHGCSRADWMLWLAVHFIDRKIMILSTCDCLETALNCIKKDEDRPRRAIAVTKLWAEGKANLGEVKQAAVDAAAAYDAYAAYAAVAADVVYAAATIAHFPFAYSDINAANNITIDVAINAVAVTYNAAYTVAAHAAADAAAHAINTGTKVQRSENLDENLKKLASLVRKRITAEMIEESLLKGTQR